MNRLGNLLDELASLFREGSEPIAKIAAEACVRHKKTQTESAGEAELRLHNQIVGVLKQTNTPIAKAVIAVEDELEWRYPGYEEGRISEDVALRMQTVELIGPTGMMLDEECRVGLFSQKKNTDYVTRTHEAEELFIQIAGEAEWTKNNQPYRTKQAGDRIHHLSNQPHASRTVDSAMVAVWVWTGNISFETYQYTGKK